MAEFKGKFEKLNNTNFINWKFKIELLLKKENLWKAIAMKAPRQPPNTATAAEKAEFDKASTEWNRADEEAFSVIGLLIEDDQIVHIRNETSALGAWNKLKQYHEKATLSNKVHLMRTICSLKMDEGGNVPEHINQMQNLFVKLKDISNEELTEPWSVAMLLSSLPRGYDTLITALEARKEDELTFGFVQQKLIAEYERRIHADRVPDSTEKVLKAAHKGKAKGSSCYFCKRPNHMKKDCAEYKKWKAKKESSTNVAASKGTDKVNSAEQNDYVFSMGRNKSGWLLDSGATRHVVNSKQFFLSLDESYRGSIEVGNGQKVSVAGIGTGRIKFVDQKGAVHEALAKEVLFAPSMVGNMFRQYQSEN